MTSYIAWYGKKRVRLAEMEMEFINQLHHQVTGVKLDRGAEEVRLAQIRALKSKRAELKPSGQNELAIAHLNDEIKFWMTLSVEEIIDGYKSGKLRGHRLKVVRNLRKH
ncbi:MAG TPA: hypothetical protein PK402_02425 [Tepidisphaeraceae bacterium]|nr:hypothetical protein [Tepidisphaeraceae bacterium]